MSEQVPRRWTTGYTPASCFRHRLQDCQEGKIAFLITAERFSQDEYSGLIGSQYIHHSATGHPVIIIKKLSSKTVLIATISAYSSGPENGYLPPWKQTHRKDKNYDDFRSLFGSERSNERPFLQLETGQKMPKLGTDWIDVQSVWELPLAVIVPFRHRGCATDLNLRQDSLLDLQRHIASNCRHYEESWDLGSTFQRRNPIFPRSLPLFLARLKGNGPAVKTSTGRVAEDYDEASSVSSQDSDTTGYGTPHYNLAVPSMPSTALPTKPTQTTGTLPWRRGSHDFNNQKLLSQSWRRPESTQTIERATKFPVNQGCRADSYKYLSPTRMHDAPWSNNQSWRSSQATTSPA